MRAPFFAFGKPAAKSPEAPPARFRDLSPRAKAAAAGLILVSASLSTAISQFESSGRVITTPYRDIVGVWTVCDGITGKHVIPGKEYTPEECKALAAGEIEKHGLGLLGCLNVPIGQRPYEALTSWTFNVGVGAACGSTLVRKINAGEPPETYCKELHRWNRAGGQVVKGLVNRRWAEYDVCVGKGDSNR